jgi:hypothetical protein
MCFRKTRWARLLIVVIQFSRIVAMEAMVRDLCRGETHTLIKTFATVKTFLCAFLLCFHLCCAPLNTTRHASQRPRQTT